MPEALVQDLWRTQRFDTSRLATADGHPLRVLDPGRLNTDAGPDFLNARLLMNGVEWVGAVEVHVQSGGWYAHDHHTDARYNSVVLHVTLYPDMWTGGLLRADGSGVPELALADRLQRPLRKLLHAFLTHPADTLPCAAQWKDVPATVRTSFVEHLGRERLRTKARALGDQYQVQPSLESLLYLKLAQALGYAKNAAPMALLAQRVPLAVARAAARTPTQLDALFLGTAGLLPDEDALQDAGPATRAYVDTLRALYGKLQHQHHLQPMDRAQWQFFRLRPANFPPLRVAQLAALFHTGGLLQQDPVGQLVAGLDADDPLEAWDDLLTTTAPPAFWRTHYRLATETADRFPGIGQTRRRALLTNAVLPLLLLYAEQEAAPPVRSAVFDLLQRLPAERDRVIRRFAALGSRPKNALMAQGYHALYRSFCTQGRCLSCKIGAHVLTAASHDPEA
ncbi:MAG: DUF2851 family protein [Bacteroidetes bacterium]|nr:DUF2851 family protein [Bacteroidota bacterium]